MRLRRVRDKQRGAAVTPSRLYWQLAARLGLWSMVAFGALGGLVGCMAMAVATSDDGVFAAASEGPELTPVQVTGVAEHVVRRWIELPDQRDLFVDAHNPRAAPGPSWRGRSTAPVALREVGERYWAVVVAAEVDEIPREGEPARSTWYVEVGVVEVDGALGVVTEPALVPALPDVDGIRLAGRPLAVPDRSDGVTASVEGFLGALLAGEGRVGPYVEPGVQIDAVDPAPFTSIVVERQTVNDLADGTRSVRASVRGTTHAGSQRSVSYALVFAERAGRWEVVSVSGAPPITRTATTVGPEAGVSDSSVPTTSLQASTSTTPTTVPIASAPGA